VTLFICSSRLCDRLHATVHQGEADHAVGLSERPCGELAPVVGTIQEMEHVPGITGLAFIAANLGALEILGLAANGAKYGVAKVLLQLQSPQRPRVPAAAL
jgi:hypothetical protein